MTFLVENKKRSDIKRIELGRSKSPPTKKGKLRRRRPRRQIKRRLKRERQVFPKKTRPLIGSYWTEKTLNFWDKKTNRLTSWGVKAHTHWGNTSRKKQEKV